MIAPLTKIHVAREFQPLEHVSVVTEIGIDARIKDVGFSADNYASWLAGRGLMDDSDVPLQFRLCDRADSDRFCEDGYVTEGSFENGDGTHAINLYLGYLLDRYEDPETKTVSEVAQGRINYKVNSTAAHEIEHHVQTIQDGPLSNVYDELIGQGLTALAADWCANPPGSDEVCVKGIIGLMEGVRSGVSHQQYLDQDHEVRAREVAAVFDANPLPILTVNLR